MRKWRPPNSKPWPCRRKPLPGTTGDALQLPPLCAQGSCSGCEGGSRRLAQPGHGPPSSSRGQGPAMWVLMQAMLAHRCGHRATSLMAPTRSPPPPACSRQASCCTPCTGVDAGGARGVASRRTPATVTGLLAACRHLPPPCLLACLLPAARRRCSCSRLHRNLVCIDEAGSLCCSTPPLQEYMTVRGEAASHISLGAAPGQQAWCWLAGLAISQHCLAASP